MPYWPKGKKSSVLAKILIKIFPFKKTTTLKCPLHFEDSQFYIPLSEVQIQISNFPWDILTWTSQSPIKYIFSKPNFSSSQIPSSKTETIIHLITCAKKLEASSPLPPSSLKYNLKPRLSTQHLESLSNISSLQLYLQCPHPSSCHLPCGLT